MLAKLGYPRLDECLNDDGDRSFVLYAALFCVKTFLLIYSFVIGVFVGFLATVVPWFALLIVAEMIFGWTVPFKLFGFIIVIAGWIGITIYCTLHFSKTD